MSAVDTASRDAQLRALTTIVSSLITLTGCDPATAWDTAREAVLEAAQQRADDSVERLGRALGGLVDGVLNREIPPIAWVGLADIDPDSTI